MWISDFGSIEYSRHQPCYGKNSFPKCRHIIDLTSFQKSRTEIEIRLFVFQVQSKLLVSMNVFDEGIHIFYIHLPIRIESHKSFDLKFITIFFNEIISCLIGSTTSPIDGMSKDNNHFITIFFLFI